MLHSPAWAHFVEMLANFRLSGVAAELDGPYVPQKHIMPFPFTFRFPIMSAPPPVGYWRSTTLTARGVHERVF